MATGSAKRTATTNSAGGPRGGRFWAVIPAGGAGTRLWPLSRSTRPKYLLPLTGKQSLLQQTFERLTRLTAPERILIVCGAAHVAAIVQQLPDLPASNVIVEPSPSGTAPALALATALIASRDPNAIVGSFAADHDVTNVEGFVSAVRTAIVAARSGDLVTIGITPSRPETGYGYIERTDEMVAETVYGNAYRAARFVEKPDAARAAGYVASGKFLWNAAMFVWRAQSLLGEMHRLLPDVAQGVSEIAGAWGGEDQDRVAARVWSTMPEVTIDTGVMEQAQRVAVVPAEMGWSDVGDFHSLGELIEQDGLGNSVRGDLLQIDTTNSVIWSETGRMVAMIGLDNIIVVDTEDALLVVDRSKSQEVRKVVSRLKDGLHDELS